jgi:nucleoside phosphorylase
MLKRLKHEDYTVGWICPLLVEKIAALKMLDEEHEPLEQLPADHNVYNLGCIKGHNVVIAGLHQAGNSVAATVVAQMITTFPHIRFGMLVGIGGGVPTQTDEGMIRLGHVVVSYPTGNHSGAVQFNRGKAEEGEFKRTGALAPPPRVLQNAVIDLEAKRAGTLDDPVAKNIKRIHTTIPGLSKYSYPGLQHDHLYQPDYIHPNPDFSCDECRCDHTRREDLSSSDANQTNLRVVAHRGTIATSDLVIKSGRLRNQLAKEYKVLCFEMEAAGALTDFPCIVIRGIADYSDSHKNDRWHGYAAAAAAAYARQLFIHMPIDKVNQEQRLVLELETKHQ